MPSSVTRHGFKEHQLATFRRLDRLGPRTMLAALDRVGHETLQVWRGAIHAGVNAAGGVLAGLSPSYAKRKQREFPGQAVLVRTGTLVNSLAYQLSEKRRFVYGLALGASGQKAHVALMQITGTYGPKGSVTTYRRRGIRRSTYRPSRDFTRMPPGWFRARLLAGVEALGLRSGT